MKKRLLGMACAVALAMGMFGLMGCSSDEGSSSDGASASGEISVYSREDGSGTRGAFVELMGIEQKDASGEKVDMTTPSAAITNSTSVMMTSVSGDENGIGYISLGSLNDTVKALEVDGVAATAENVADGSYSVARPFNIVLNGELSDVAQDFVDFIMSADGQAIVEETGYIAVAGDEAYEASNKSGKIVLAGSSSVTPVMEKLSEAYQELNPDVSIEVNQSDSTSGVNMALEGTCDIGMASRELKDSEIEAGAEPVVIAQDGIAVVVNNGNAANGLSSEQIMQIFTGEVTSWADVQA